MTPDQFRRLLMHEAHESDGLLHDTLPDVTEHKRTDGRGVDLACGLFYASVWTDKGGYIGAEWTVGEAATGSIQWSQIAHVDAMIAVLIKARALMIAHNDQPASET